MGDAECTFLAARYRGETAGMVLVRRLPPREGQPVLLVDFMIVVPASQRRGIGRHLLDAVLALAPPTAILACACTPSAVGMMRLLAQSDFRCVQASRTVGGVCMPNIFERLPCRVEAQPGALPSSTVLSSATVSGNQGPLTFIASEATVRASSARLSLSRT